MSQNEPRCSSSCTALYRTWRTFDCHRCHNNKVRDWEFPSPKILLKIRFYVFKTYSAMTCYCAIFNFVYDLGPSRTATLNTRIDIAVEPNAVLYKVAKNWKIKNLFIYLFIFHNYFSIYSVLIFKCGLFVFFKNRHCIFVLNYWTLLEQNNIIFCRMLFLNIWKLQ